MGRARAEAREAAKNAGPSKKQLKNLAYWKKKREKSKAKQNETSYWKNQDGLSGREIEERQQIFQAKKQRRLERREAARAAGVVHGEEAAAPIVGKDKGDIKEAKGKAEDKNNKKAEVEELSHKEDRLDGSKG